MIAPMLASLADAPLDDPQLVYEPKYDGIRAIVEIDGTDVRIWSRLGNEKTKQFPEIVEALKKWAPRLKSAITLDGEIVALDERGEPTGFQHLQGRIHLGGSASLGSLDAKVALIVFDLLKEGRTDWRDRPLLERRAALERVVREGKALSPVVRLSQQVRGDGRALYKEALDRGWEGLIAKHAASLYKSGKRTPDWHKLKIVHEQEFVVGGWTEPRQTRSYFGALLLGVYGAAPVTARGARPLVYVGHIGTGFNEKELARVMALLRPLETETSPFAERPKTNERPHWVRPKLVAQVRFTEWTTDGKLRHPVYLGLRDDKKAAEVRREEPSSGKGGMSRKGGMGRKGGTDSKGGTGVAASGGAARPVDSRATRPERFAAGALDALVDQLSELERARRDGVLALPDGDTIAVTNLHKVFWPQLKLTKGDLFRYYARVAAAILPVIADRPLVMKRFPNGITAKPFYQHRAEDAPPGVRTEVVQVGERRSHIIGGSLKTLMYTTQLAAISQDPWFSRVQHPTFADHVALDLDPADGLPFARCLDVARWIHDELRALGGTGWPKTSGASGLHVYIPLPPRTPYDAGLLFCQIVATVIAQKHPKVATIERKVASRGKRVYVDALQNVLGKTLASAYSARASDYAGVSTPLSWDEVEAGVDRRAFTLTTVPARIEAVGDLWNGLLEAPGIDLARVSRRLKEKK
jgi:bifunctional non-homologous end joining protein LigD